jgi:hypothetical protein
MALARPTARRRFGLLDAMILVVASAGCFGWFRSTSNQEVGWTFYSPVQPSQFFQVSVIARVYFEIFAAVLVSITLATLVMRFRRPRPTLSMLMRQPGLIATLTASISIVLFSGKQALVWVVDSAFDPGRSLPMSNFQVLSNSLPLGNMAAVTGLIVLSAWLILWLGRRYRFERSWIDRLGRLVGLAWIAAIPLQVSLDLLHSLSLRGLL